MVKYLHTAGAVDGAAQTGELSDDVLGLVSVGQFGGVFVTNYMNVRAVVEGEDERLTVVVDGDVNRYEAFGTFASQNIGELLVKIAVETHPRH